MSFMDSIKSWLSGNKDTVNNAVDKGGEFLKNKAPQHEDKIDAARDKFDGVFNKESEPLTPQGGHGSKETEDKSDSSEVKSEANPMVPEEESSVSEGVGEDSPEHENAGNTAEISGSSADNLSDPEDSTKSHVDEDAEDVSVGSGEETVETIPDFTIDDESTQRADIDPDSPAGFTELSEEQDLDFSPVVEPEPENEKLVEDATIEVDDTKDSEGSSDVVSEDVDDSRAVSGGRSDVVSEDYDVSSRAVSEGSSDVDSEDADSRAEDATLSTPLSTEDPLETSASRGESVDSTESEIPAPEAPSESPVQVEEDVNSAIEEEDLIDPKNNALTGFVEDDNKAEGSVEGSDLVNTEVTGFSLKEPDEDFSLTDNTLKDTIADKVEDSDSSKTLGDLLDEDNRE